MSVLIKGMDMPKDCDSCFMADKCEHRHYVLMKDEYGSFVPRLVKDDCPLVEVPTPHGRLIDAETVLPRIEAEISMYKQRLANLPEEPDAVLKIAEHKKRQVEENLLDAMASYIEVGQLLLESSTIIEAEE